MGGDPARYDPCRDVTLPVVTYAVSFIPGPRISTSNFPVMADLRGMTGIVFTPSDSFVFAVTSVWCVKEPTGREPQ